MVRVKIQIILNDYFTHLTISNKKHIVYIFLKLFSTWQPRIVRQTWSLLYKISKKFVCPAPWDSNKCMVSGDKTLAHCECMFRTCEANCVLILPSSLISVSVWCMSVHTMPRYWWTGWLEVHCRYWSAWVAFQ